MRILHFSDVHLNATKPEATQKLVNRMMNAIKEKYGENPDIDLVVFTGDMIDGGGLDKEENVIFRVEEGFECFKRNVILPICDQLNLSVDRFVVVPGNHDMDWKAAVDGELDDIRTQLESSKFSDSTILGLYEKYVESGKTPWMESFLEFRDSLYGGFPYKASNSCANIVIEIGGKRIGISMLNCAWAALRGIQYVPVCIEQIREACDWLNEHNCEYRIAVMHNPTDTLGEDERLAIRREITTEYNLFLSGHMHQEDDYGLIEGASSAICCVAPKLSKSALSEHDERYKNGFLMIEENWADYVNAIKFEQKPNHTFAVDANYGENGTKQIRRPEKRRINGISELFALRDQLLVGKFPYLHNESIDGIAQRLLNKDIQFIRLAAMPGFGKTRLLYDTFWSARAEMAKSKIKAYYCEDCTEEGAVYKELVTIALPEQEGLIILDNCQRPFIEKVVGYISMIGTHFRLIAVDNDPYDFTSIPQCEAIMLEPDVLLDEVNSYIDNNVPGGNAADSVKYDIKMISDGFPFMAFQLVETFKRGQQIQLADADSLVRRMLQVNGREEDYRYQHVLQAMALFLPMPTYENDDVAYKFVVSSDEITHLEEKDFHNRHSFFKKAIRRYQSNLLEVTQDWLKVRPFPLAVWLLKDWFDTMEHAELLKIISDIGAQPECTAKLLINGMARRLETMQDNVSAKLMVDKLMEPSNGSFCSEKVVCSELGSRLFLAMSTVNPEKVAVCLRYLFKDKDTDWLKANIQGDVRRNLVWALNKLCFAHESFEDAVIVMAQFAEAENEYWSNNSQGNLTQIFPIMLPDTEVDLQQRLTAIESLWNAGFQQQALRAVNTAFKNNGFTRMVGAENFGWHRREAYQPKRNSEIRQYWDGCFELLKKWFAEDEEITWGAIVKIVESHIYDWRVYDNMERYLFPLVNLVYPRMNGSWRNVYEELERLTQHLEPEIYKEEQKGVIQTQLERLRPKRFADRIMYEGRRVFDSHEMADLETNEKAKIIFEPLVQSFIDDRIFENIDELKYLSETNVSCGLFVQELKDSLSDETLQILCDNLWEITCGQGDTAPLYFTSSVLMCFRKKKTVRDFVDKALHAGMFSVYVRALAIMEDEYLNSYHTLLAQYDLGTLQYSHIDLYLNSLWGINHQQIATLLPMLLERFPEEIVSIGAFVMRYRYWIGIFEEDIKPHVRALLLKYPLLKADQYMNVDYLSFVGDYLKLEEKDVPFAIEINRKVLRAMSERMIHNSSECRLYEELLLEPYQSAIWEDFTHAFEDEKSGVLVFMQMQYEIGSGFSFAKGALFKHVNEERLMEWGCTSTRIRHYLAQMAPVFNYQEDNPHDGFSDFIMWLLDNYGNEEGVRSGVSCNMNTYSWTGAQYELNDDKIKTLSSLLNHKFAEVREWATREIEECKKANEMEKSRDDFMRMHYS